jgi:hypothetical protein
MHEDPPPRPMPERTGKHVCTRCLTVIPANEYFRNDHICDRCASSDEYSVVPEPKAPKKK